MHILLVNNTDFIGVQCYTGQWSSIAHGCRWLDGTILLRTKYTVSCSFEISMLILPMHFCRHSKDLENFHTV